MKTKFNEIVEMCPFKMSYIELEIARFFWDISSEYALNLKAEADERERHNLLKQKETK